MGLVALDSLGCYGPIDKRLTAGLYLDICKLKRTIPLRFQYTFFIFDSSSIAPSSKVQIVLCRRSRFGGGPAGLLVATGLAHQMHHI